MTWPGDRPDLLSPITSPRLNDVLGRYAPDCEFDCIDPDSPAESVTWRWPDEAIDEFSQQVDAAITVVEPMDEAQGAHYLRMHTSLPAGLSWAEWLFYLRGHLREFYPDRYPQTINGDGTLPSRASRFDDKDTANRAATDVLRHNESLLRAWADTPADSPDHAWRLHLYADLGRRVGEYYPIRQIAGDRIPDDTPDGQPIPHEATAAVVLMSRARDTGKPYIATTYPEAALAIEPRHRHPDLTLLFGGYLGQDHLALNGNRWVAERDLNHSQGPAVRERIVDQLALLLTEDDEGLAAAVDALGSYVQPKAMRRWVTGLHRRMTRLAW
jgi:hypothetical protein